MGEDLFIVRWKYWRYLLRKCSFVGCSKRLISLRYVFVRNVCFYIMISIIVCIFKMHMMLLNKSQGTVTLPDSARWNFMLTSRLDCRSMDFLCTDDTWLCSTARAGECIYTIFLYTMVYILFLILVVDCASYNLGVGHVMASPSHFPLSIGDIGQL